MSTNLGNRRRGQRSHYTGSERRNQSKRRDQLTTVDKALRYLLSNSDRMLEERAHALMFLGELVALKKYGVPLSGATYQRDAYSVYADEVTRCLESMNLRSRKVYRGEHRVPVYDTRDVSSPEINDEAAGVLDEVKDVVEDLSTDKIVEMCRKVPVVHQARLGKRIELTPNLSNESIQSLKNLVHK